MMKGENIIKETYLKENLSDSENNDNRFNTNDCEQENIPLELELENMRKSYKIREKILIYEFLNFLEVYIHTVLYLSCVYPQDAFYSYTIYNLKFLKFMADDEVNEYITEFLKNCEDLLFTRYLKKIYILIVDVELNKIIEIFNLELDVVDKLYNLKHEDVCLDLKSILYKLYTSYVNRKVDDNFNKINKTFLLCIETKESKVISNLKLFDEISNCIEENFVKNLFKSDFIKIYERKEVCAIVEEINYSIKIVRNY